MIVRHKKTEEVLEIVPVAHKGGFKFKDIKTNNLYDWDEFIPYHEKPKAYSSSMSVTAPRVMVNIGIGGSILTKKA